MAMNPKVKNIYTFSIADFGRMLTIYFVMIFSSQIVSAQTIPVDDIKEEQLRIQQLFQGSVYSSFTNRPVWNYTYDAYLDSAEQEHGFWTRKLDILTYDLGYTFRAGIYQPSLAVTTNSTVPYGENNSAAWYGRGLNTEFQGGFWITSDYLTIAFKPHIIQHQNTDFEVPRFIPSDSEGNRLFVAEAVGDVIDRPFRFGDRAFSTSDLGHSSIRVHYKQMEAGLSNEPLWWGGNVKYPLLISNNAPGFKHFFMGTRSPLKVPYVGKFEFKWIGAFPEDSDYFQNEEDADENRFMNAINISYSPFFAPNFHVGFARAIHTYLENNRLSGEDIGMVLDPFLYVNFLDKRGAIQNLKPRNHMNSIYARWLWPESRFEIYAEYFRDDFAYDSRDLLMEPRHNSGYAFGFQQLVFAPSANFYKVNLEFTNMTPSYLQEVRPQNYYYTHPEIRQGHTNRGQVIGAAIGPGSNSQFLGIDGYFDSGRLGIFVRRLADNNHFHYQYDRSLNRPEEFRQGFGDYWRNRTDLTIGTRGLYAFGDFLLTGEFSWTKLYNYGRFDYGRFQGITIANFEPYDITNVQFRLSVSYLF